MKSISTILIFAAFVLFIRLHSAMAAESSASATLLQPPAYTMSIACFTDTIDTRPEWIFVVGGNAYRSLDALKDGITHFVKGSSLTWAPSCKRFGGEPLSSETELKDFEAHCKSHGVRFILVPSG